VRLGSLSRILPRILRVALRGAVGHDLKDGVVAEGVVVVLVLVARKDAVDAAADHLQERVLAQVGVAGVVEGAGVGPGKPDALVELADGEPSGVAGQLALGRLDDERRAKKIEDLWPRRW
jgi:hypothetical protein